MAPTAVEIGSSRWTAGVLAALHLGAVILPLGTGAPAVVWVALVPAVAASAWWQLRLHALRTAPGAWVELLPGSAGAWQMVRRSGAVVAVQDLPERCFVSPALVLFWAKDAHRRYCAVVARDAVDHESFRRLRVWLLRRRRYPGKES